MCHEKRSLLIRAAPPPYVLNTPLLLPSSSSPTTSNHAPRPFARTVVVHDGVLVDVDPAVKDSEGAVARTPPNVADGFRACKESDAHFEKELVDGCVLHLYSFE